MEMIKEGDRVVKRGYLWKEETPRYGTATKCYYGKPTTIDKGIPLVDVLWDDGSTSCGFINGSGSLVPFTAFPSFQVL